MLILLNVILQVHFHLAIMQLSTVHEEEQI